MTGGTASPPWIRLDDGLRLNVRLTPKSGRDDIDGVVRLSDGRAVLAAHVRALPDKGAANAALVKLLAKSLGVGNTQIEVVAGKTARLKTIMIRGDGAALIRVLEELV